MGMGLGFIADGFLKGQARNRDWSLRQKQEQRAQESFGLSSEATRQQIELGKENLTEEAVAARAAARQYNQTILGNQADVSGYNADVAKNNASPEAIEMENEKRTLGLKNAKLQSEGYGLSNESTRQQIELGKESLTEEAVAARKEAAQLELEAKRLANQYNEYRNTEAGQKVSEETLAWDKRFSDIVNQKNEEIAKVELADAIDMKRYRMVQLLESGDQAGFAMMINSAKDNKLEDVVGGRITPDGRVQGVNAKGEIVVDIPKDEVDGLKSRMKQRQKGSDKEPKVMTEAIFDEMGQKVGERPYILQTDPATGEQYIKYLEERSADGDEISVAKLMVQGGEMTEEEFEALYGQPYESSKPQNPRPQQQAAPDPYAVGIPRPRPAPTTPTQPGGILRPSSASERYSRSVPLDPNASLYR